ncbi:MAG: VOC family protein [Chitinophagaceae bacterium]|nr:VOC family protein [Chitinophagaceae bacterium]
MLISINPKLPMRDKSITRDFFTKQLHFTEFGSHDFDGYLMLEKDQIQIHFFEFKNLNIYENYGQVYIRTNQIDELYQTLLKNKVTIHPNGALEEKPWGQKEFLLLDPDHNLITFGQAILQV